MADYFARLSIQKLACVLSEFSCVKFYSCTSKNTQAEKTIQEMGEKIGPRIQRRTPAINYAINYTHSNQEKTWMKAINVYAFTVKDINGTNVPMSNYRGKLLLIVNVASKSHLTGLNYAMLMSLHRRYSSRGLAILAFPCNQFLNQEPGTNEEIAEAARERNIKFDMFSKINVNGDDACPLWKYLKLKSRKNAEIKSSFTKFIVNRKGRVVRRISTVAVKKVEQVVSPYFRNQYRSQYL